MGRTLDVPDTVEVTVNCRVVTVKGPRGELSKSFKHQRVDLQLVEGEKRPRIVNMLEGVTIKRDKDVKDQYILEGNDIENVSRSCSLIYTACLVKKKDIRKFLDGMYVSEKGLIQDGM